jgi:hypothetical protein
VAKEWGHFKSMNNAKAWEESTVIPTCGLGETDAAQSFLEKVLELVPFHVGTVLHKALSRYRNLREPLRENKS